MTMNIQIEDIPADITQQVASALKEDIQTGDITAQLIPAEKTSTAEVITREECVICGQDWVNETFEQLGNVDELKWHVKEGESVTADTVLFTAKGNSRTLLTGERTALNFLQLLSGVATKSRRYADLVAGTNIKILDTRKTIPGLRTAQKYAVTIGGCHNHRIGLYDAFLIKENHIAACGGIAEAVNTARLLEPGKKVEVEVESIEELKSAIEARADVIMLDNFDENMLLEACKLPRGKCLYEVSGNVDPYAIELNKKYRINFISIGDLTKNIKIIDLSMRLS